MGLTARLDDYQRRHRWIGLPLAVVYKFFDDQGPYLSALLTYYGFLSLFPLLLVMTTVLGFVLGGNPHLQQEVVRSALREFPIIGTQLGQNVRSLHGSGLGLVVGIVATVYGGLGIAQAGQAALNRVWGVPRNERPNPFMARLKSLLLLVVLGFGVAITTVLSAVGAAAQGYGANVGGGARIAAIAASMVVNAGLFVVAFRVMTARRIATRDVLVGALCAAVAWQVLQTAGTYYLQHKLRGATEVYGLFGLVLGLIAWIYLEAVTVVLAAEINVVRAKRLWPRALLTPFTDRVELTDADERSYESYANSERHKGFEEVNVSFDRDTSDEAVARPDKRTKSSGSP
ncbi:MAG: YihY/virulence factor BrkB family protein [Actinomycetota bacterium]|nr:YihY/virulence factor BrkB family protein [Actinomycetota bacterium]